MTRSLLLKGLAGVAALGGTVGGLAVYRKEIFGWGKAPEEPKSEDVSGFTQKELIDKVGLNCGLDGNELTDNTSKDCTVKENGFINVKVRDSEEEGVTFTGNGAKLKVSKNEETGADGTDKYTKKLKFVVDSGDLTLTKKEGGGNATTIPKLEQFETYEIFLKNDDKFYLRRKTDAKEEKIKALELPTGKGKCSLPESGDSSCTLTIEEAKKVKFEGHNGQQINLSGVSVSLKVSKVEDTTSFPDGYRFTFTFPGDVSINGKTLKGNTPYDFKIKKGSGNTLTLEKAWSEDSVFTKKAGLDCTTDSQCNVSSDSQKLNVKVGEKKKEDISSIDTSSGKIKMEKDQPGYNQGLKFTITTADVSLTGGADSGSGDAISKLEELETYEITEEGGKYYLTRKATKEESIRSSLSIPEECFTAAGGSCTLSQDAFKAINFEGKSNASASGNITLKISKVTNTTDFPLGYRFTFSSDKEATIAASTNTIKANIPTDYKIKKSDSTPTTLSLEKAWSEFSFAEKVGLTCTTGSDGCCTKSGSSELNVKKGTDKKEKITSAETSSSKIKVEKDKEGYNQGLKFTITGGDVSLSGGTDVSGNIQKLEELETYEITEEGDKYYLTRKDEASKTIVDLLGLADAGCNISATSCTLSTEQIKKVKFDGKDATGPTASANATLTISKTDKKEDFPLGYKFTLQSEQEITIKTNEKVAAKIPTDFKIKKGSGSVQSVSLTLEKAWTMDSLGKKVGLQSCTESSNECTVQTSGGSLKVKQDDKTDTGLSKGSASGSSSAKIKVKKDQEGYNQGFKFEIEGGSISLTGGSKSDDNDKIKKLGEYETYEIKEEGGEWYFVRKKKADDFILNKLGLDNISTCTSLKLPEPGDSAGDSCSIEKLEDLKKIKFENATGHTWPTEAIKIQLMINNDTTDSGFKFNFSEDSSTASKVCLPTGTTGGGVDIKDSSNTSGVDYKIKKCSKGDTISLSLVKSGNGSSQCK